MGLEKINDYKKVKGYTNKMLSELTGISISSLDKITSGENTNPKLGTVRLICTALDCSLDDLLDGENSNSNSIASKEMDIIKKYRTLDTHGIKMVDYVLNEEYARCESTRKTSKQTQSEAAIPIVIAAQGGGINTEISPENENAVLDKLEELEKNERKNNLGL